MTRLPVLKLTAAVAALLVGLSGCSSSGPAKDGSAPARPPPRPPTKRPPTARWSVTRA
ncbi:hypothetical protein ACFQ0M_07545 [Kitasatospora aburaviensis]